MKYERTQKLMKIQHTRQQGVALVTSLILLVGLSMLGITSMQRATSDLAMAGNQRETALMFQSAEMGLAQAEQFIVSQVSNTVYNQPGKGLYTVPDDATAYSRDYYDANGWTSQSTIANTALKSELDLADDPRYIIEYVGDRRQNPRVAFNMGGGYGDIQTGEVVSIYRATARGAGLAGSSYRFVQSYYGIDAP